MSGRRRDMPARDPYRLSFGLPPIGALVWALFSIGVGVAAGWKAWEGLAGLEAGLNVTLVAAGCVGIVAAVVAAALVIVVLTPRRGARVEVGGEAELRLGAAPGVALVVTSADPYERGVQQGRLFAAEIVSTAPRAVQSACRRMARLSVLAPVAALLLDAAWALGVGRRSRAAAREMEGLADGSGARLCDLRRLDALVVRTEWAEGAEAKVSWMLRRGWRDRPVLVAHATSDSPGAAPLAPPGATPRAQPCPAFVVTLRVPGMPWGVTAPEGTDAIVAHLEVYGAPLIIDAAAALARVGRRVEPALARDPASVAR